MTYIEKDYYTIKLLLHVRYLFFTIASTYLQVCL